MPLKDLIKNDEVIFIAPSELRSYFLSERKLNPFLNFKFFTFDEIIRNLRGYYLDKNVLKIGLEVFRDKSFSTIREIAKYVFYKPSLDDETSEEISMFCRVLKENNLLFLNDDFLNLLLNRKIIFLNYEDSNLVKNFIKELNLSNYEFETLAQIMPTRDEYHYHEFFSIGDELKYVLNDILRQIDEGANPGEFEVILDLDRYQFYLDLFLQNLNLPINVERNDALTHSQIFKDIYPVIDEKFDVFDYLNKNKERYDKEEFELVYNTLSFYEFNQISNKKLNFKEILSTLSIKESDSYINAITFKNRFSFDINKRYYIIGLDSSFLPKAIKDNKYFSYDFLYSHGLDSLNDKNLMNSKLDRAFINFKNVNFYSYHLKDNNGRYSKSYYFDDYGFHKIANENQEVEYVKELANLYYRNALDKFKKSGVITDELTTFKALHNNENLETYSSNFKKLSNFEYDSTKEYSYSNLKVFHDCPFQYFVSKILNLSINETSIYQKEGTIIHSILEHVYETNFDFDVAFKNALIAASVNYESLSEKDQIILKRLSFEIKQAIDLIILPHKANMSLIDENHEMKLFKFVDIDCYKFTDFNPVKVETISYKTSLIGYPDSILEMSDHSLYIIDYKTGRDTFSKSAVLNYSSNLQLPTYIYLLENNPSFHFKDKYVRGVFLEKMVINAGKFYNYINPSNEDKETIMYDGAFYDDYDSLSLFDYSINDVSKKSEFVIGLSTKKKLKNGKPELSGNGKAKSRLCKPDDFILLSKKVEENLIDSVRRIAFGSFYIWPFRKSNDKPSESCSYCKFSDICFKRNFIDKDME